AGVGRTGTYIALSNLMEEMKHNDTVDIFQAVYNMRQNRENMVQTLDQYEFIYRTILTHHSNPADASMTRLNFDIPDVVPCTVNPARLSDEEDYYKEDVSANKNSANGDEISLEEYPISEYEPVWYDPPQVHNKNPHCESHSNDENSSKYKDEVPVV
ncbi:hypothetical protein SK128_005379, partial [Halocaridina rubra]